jgi:hypothetical protein
VDSLPIIEHKCFAFVEPTVFFENSVLILPLELNCKTEKWLGRQDYSFGLWPYSPLWGCRRFALAFKCFAFVEPTVFFENSVLILPLELNCKTEKWLGRQDSNLRMLRSKPSALPLGDAPFVLLFAVFNKLMRYALEMN